MAKGVRGKLKENLEGIHRNCEWIKQHCEKSVDIIPVDSRYKSLIDNFKAFSKCAETLDELVLNVYSKV